ncbi:hypothetical protein TNCV_3616171 [Trichonephila clavipes]|nr:hypothetical protein TNCV_3616171 [Trichonephila clavipes]
MEDLEEISSWGNENKSKSVSVSAFPEPGLASPVLVTVHSSYFVDGLKEEEIQKAVRIADVQDLKSALKLGATTQTSRKDRHSIREARVTADEPCESRLLKEMERGIERGNAKHKGWNFEPRETQLQVLGMLWNGTPEKKLSSSMEGREHRLFYQTGHLIYGHLAGRRLPDNEKLHHIKFSRLRQ